MQAGKSGGIWNVQEMALIHSRNHQSDSGNAYSTGNGGADSRSQIHSGSGQGTPGAGIA